MKKILLFDGNALLYRAYHAFPKELTTPKGEIIGAVYGFTRLILSTLKTLAPESVAVCFDLSGPTFRQQKYPLYKATRQKMPDDLLHQIARTHQIVQELEIPIYSLKGYEADDCLGTLASQIYQKEEDSQIVIVSSDQDLIQLVNDRIFVYTPASYPRQPVLYTPEKVQEKYGFSPGQMVQYKALRGDPSDNIPGVPGIGEVTATKLVQTFQTILHLYQDLDQGLTRELKPGLIQKLIENKAKAFLSLELATIDQKVPILFDSENCKISLLHPEKLTKLLQELGFQSLITYLPKSHKLLSEASTIFAINIPNNISSLNQEVSESSQIDLDLDPVLRQMEKYGVQIDLNYLKKLELEYTDQLTQLKKTLLEGAGEEFNPDSPSQVAHILYEILKIPTSQIRKGKTGYSTDASTLLEISKTYPIGQILLKYREFKKLQTTYVQPLEVQADQNKRIHTTYAPDTSTGRISSKNPNLQNIPVRSREGRRLRRAFIASPGTILVAADYSQMELRIAAHLSKDPKMQEVFRRGGDFHAETAKALLVDRRIAKIINFSILYGKGAFGFAKDLNISVSEAKRYIEQYFQTYHVLHEYLDNLQVSARKNGYLSTMFGRRREFPDLYSKNFQKRSAAEREVRNFPIQGSQADILKMAMLKLSKSLKPLDHLILTVHDELILEVPKSEQKAAGIILKESMTQIVKLSVPIEVNLKKGPNWANLSEFII